MENVEKLKQMRAHLAQLSENLAAARKLNMPFDRGSRALQSGPTLKYSYSRCIAAGSCIV